MNIIIPLSKISGRSTYSVASIKLIALIVTPPRSSTSPVILQELIIHSITAISYVTTRLVELFIKVSPKA